MTHCYNCGHAGTFVLLAQFALAVPGPLADSPVNADRRDSPVNADRRDSSANGDRRGRPRFGEDHRRQSSIRGRPHDWGRACDPNRSRRRRRRGPTRDSNRDVGPSDRGESPTGDDPQLGSGVPTEGDLSFAVQCPICDSTDVGVAVEDLLARYGVSTTS